MTAFKNPLRQIWAQGRTAVNGWLAIPSVLSAEVMARAGWDSLCVDLQHGTADYSDLLTLLPVIQQTATTPLVRVPWNDPAQVMRALDAGALGIICPMTETAEEAERFVSYCRYPPHGTRSFGPVRARLVYGDSYGAAANDEVVPFVMIETKKTLDNLDDILAVEGIGALYIGPADLASSLGHTPGFDRREPELLEALDLVLAKATESGIPVGLHCGSSAYACEMAAKGFSLVTIGSDARFIEAGAKAALDGFR